MAVPLRSVLVSDEVDPQCVALLQQHGIPVTCKFKMPKEELLKEIPVRGALASLGQSAESRVCDITDYPYYPSHEESTRSLLTLSYEL